MIKKISNFFLIIVLGGLSGLFACNLLLPWLAGFEFFEKFDWIRNSREGTTIINKTERVTIAQNEAFEQAVEKGGRLVVGVLAQQTEKIVNKKTVVLPKPEILAEGTGFLVSSDGLIVTAADIVPETGQNFFVRLGDKDVKAEVRNRDIKNGIALLKINENNLPVAAFAEGELKLGQQVFLVGAKPGLPALKFTEFANVGEIGDEIVINFLRPDSNGAPVFDVQAEIAGIYLISGGEVAKFVPSAKIRELLK